MTGPRRIALDRLSVTLPSGIDGLAFRRALVTELERLDLSRATPGSLNRISLPPLRHRPGDSPATLAARTADALSNVVGGRVR